MPACLYAVSTQLQSVRRVWDTSFGKAQSHFAHKIVPHLKLSADHFSTATQSCGGGSNHCLRGLERTSDKRSHVRKDGVRTRDIHLAGHSHAGSVYNTLPGHRTHLSRQHRARHGTARHGTARHGMACTTTQHNKLVWPQFLTCQSLVRCAVSNHLLSYSVECPSSVAIEVKHGSK